MIGRPVCSPAALAVVFVCAFGPATTLAEQAPAAASSGATSASPRTAWGHPDLQGIWNNSTITPLERPDEFAGKEFLTDKDLVTLEQRAAESRIDRPPRAGDPGTYNQVWFDRGTKVVSTRRTSLILDPADGRIPYTVEARKKQEAMRAALSAGRFDSYEDIDVGERCLTDGLPMMPFVYNNNYEILQTPEYVVILHEMYQELRIIPVDGRPHAPSGIGQWFGDPRGRWEGDTLVIETTNFAAKDHYVWAARWRATRPTMRLVERLTRLDADTIDYQFTVEDPTMFTRPWTAAVPFSRQAKVGATEGRLYEYACHEGNYSIVNVLGGARAQDRERLQTAP